MLPRGADEAANSGGGTAGPAHSMFPSLSRWGDDEIPLVGGTGGGTVVDRGGGEDRGEVDTACACPGGWGSYWPMLPWGGARQQEGTGLGSLALHTFVVEEDRSSLDEGGSSEAAGGGIEAGEWGRCQLLVRGQS